MSYCGCGRSLDPPPMILRCTGCGVVYRSTWPLTCSCGKRLLVEVVRVGSENLSREAWGRFICITCAEGVAL
jgi:hypothetical protein